MPPRKSTTPFKSEHALKFGVKISERDPATKDVVSVCCLFCVHFGREENVGAKRNRTTNLKYFRKPFRSDLFRRHLVSQHTLRWKEYLALNDHEKPNFFGENTKFFGENTPVVHRNTLKSHFSGVQAPLQLLVDKSIVDDIIGELFFLEEDVNDETTKERALRVFEDVLDPSEAHENSDSSGSDGTPPDTSTARYRIHVKHPAQFYLIADYLSVGVSFRVAARIPTTMIREQTGLASIGDISEGKVATYARYICALNLQSLRDLLARVWTFSIVMDVSTRMATSYLDIRIRLHLEGEIQNFHLLAIPMFSRHTCAQIYLHIERALDALAPKWRNMIVSISSAGDRKMTRSIQGVATRFEQVALPGFYRIWCGLRQLDIKLQDFFSALMTEAFYSSLTSLVAYLRRQQNLIKEMNTKAPTVANTHWESMSKVSGWFKKNRIEVLAYLEEKQPKCAPEPSWWIKMMFIERISAEATNTFRSLEGLTTVVSQQREGLLRLHQLYARMMNASGPLLGGGLDLVDQTTEVLSQDRSFSIKLSDVNAVLEDLGLFVLDKIEETGEDRMEELVRDLGVRTANLIAGVVSVVADSDSSNEAAAELPPVLPHQLVSLRGRDFAGIVKAQVRRLQNHWTPVDIDMMEQEFQELQSSYNREQPFKEALDKCDHRTSFQDGWNLTQNRFLNLREFCGGLATAFPGTSTVESDFSIVQWEKNDGRAPLSDLSLEGILHSKQFKRMQDISNS